MLHRTSQLRIPWPASGRLWLQLGERHDGEQCTTALAQLDAPCDLVTIRGGGHWCTIRNDLLAATATPSLCAPDGRPFGWQLASLAPGASMRLFVPDGTGHIGIALAPGGERRYAAESSGIVLR